MVPKKQWIEEKTVKKLESDYFKFIYSFVEYILYPFRKTNSLKEVKMENFEQTLIQSLAILEKLHMSLYQTIPVYNEYLFQKNTTPFSSKEAKATYQLLRQLQRYVHDHSFSNPENETLCKALLTQILNYYALYSNSIKIILSPPSPPWLSKSL